MAPVTTVAEALHEIGISADVPPSRPTVLRGPSGALIPVAILGPDLREEWRGVWIGAGAEPYVVGPPSPRGLVAQQAKLSGPAASFVDLLEASIANLTEHAEEIDLALQRMEALPEHRTASAAAPRNEIDSIRATSHALLVVRRHVGRLVSIVASLDGPIGTEFPELGRVLPTLDGHVDRLQNLALLLQGSFRDILMTRSAEEGNRINEVANQLGATSNRISALANTSNLRMLGIAYLALVVALVGASLLIPDTAATILGMPSATWVPGTWVTLILVLTTAIPLAFIFTRPWVIQILRGLGSVEARSAEGVADLPETDRMGRPTGRSLSSKES